MMQWLAAGFAFLAFLGFAARRLLTYLHLFQQEEYDNRRFVAWWAGARAFDKRLSLTLLLIGIGELVAGAHDPGWLWTGAAGLALIGAAALERDPRKDAKKKLAMTARAKRIYLIALALLAVVAAIVVLTIDSVLGWLIPVQAVPFALVAANLLLAPAETRVQRRYWQEAHDKLLRLNPVVIGVTGSYGKTSVKHILGHILESAAPTLITPGSVNTAMGIARIVRERLGSHHRFVVEMGAYGIGSIRRLCELAPPQLGIVTAIGKAHYERFKTLEAVASAKFELAEAVQGRTARQSLPNRRSNSRRPAASPPHIRKRWSRSGQTAARRLRSARSARMPTASSSRRSGRERPTNCGRRFTASIRGATSRSPSPRLARLAYRPPMWWRACAACRRSPTGSRSSANPAVRC